MTGQYQQVAERFLRRHGLSGSKLDDILRGFDFRKPAYEQHLDANSIVYQFVRRSSHAAALPRIGNWFCLPGAGMETLAIFSGASGRTLAKVRLKAFLVGLEGTAAPQPRRWDFAIGGPGGVTQIFIPDNYLMTHIEVVGYETLDQVFAGG